VVQQHSRTACLEADYRLVRLHKHRGLGHLEGKPMKHLIHLLTAFVLITSACTTVQAQNDVGDLTDSQLKPEPPPTLTTPVQTPHSISIVTPEPLGERVEIEPGSNSAQLSGLLPSGLSVKQYVLAVEANQTVTIELTSSDVLVALTITSPSGNERFPTSFPADGGYRVSHTFTVVEIGDYVLTLTKADRSPSTNYTLDFSVK
jgi:heme/copper-type cytochrome/quinol oxidase subunit 2